MRERMKSKHHTLLGESLKKYVAKSHNTLLLDHLLQHFMVYGMLTML